MAEPNIRIGTHAHLLKLVIPEHGNCDFVCARCKKQSNQPRYFCTTCLSYTIDVPCAALIQEVEAKARREDFLCNVGMTVGMATLGGVVSAGVREGAVGVIKHVKEEHAANATAAAAGAAAPSEAVAGGGEAAVSEGVAGVSGAAGAADGAGAVSEWFGKAVEVFSNLPF